MVERTATDSASTDITERRPGLKHKGRVNVSKQDRRNRYLADNPTKEGWKAMMSRFFVLTDKENQCH